MSEATPRGTSRREFFKRTGQVAAASALAGAVPTSTRRRTTPSRSP